MNVLSKVMCLMAAVICTACVRYSDDLLETSRTQISHEFYGALTYPSDLAVRLYPPDASYIRNGSRHPVTLHALIERRLRGLHFIRPGHAPGTKYALIVRKQRLERNSGAVLSGYTEALESMAAGEAPYIIEIFLDEVKRNDRGEEVFGRRVALFTTLLVREEEDIAGDIVNIIMDEVR